MIECLTVRLICLMSSLAMLVLVNGCAAGPNRSDRTDAGREGEAMSQQLQEYRAAAISYLRNRQDGSSRAFIEELERGELVPNESRIGIWIVEREDQRVALIREPPPAETMYRFGLWLERGDGGWFVRNEFVERETLGDP